MLESNHAFILFFSYSCVCVTKWFTAVFITLNFINCSLLEKVFGNWFFVGCFFGVVVYKEVFCCRREWLVCTSFLPMLVRSPRAMLLLWGWVPPKPTSLPLLASTLPAQRPSPRYQSPSVLARTVPVEVAEVKHPLVWVALAFLLSELLLVTVVVVLWLPDFPTAGSKARWGPRPEGVSSPILQGSEQSTSVPNLFWCCEGAPPNHPLTGGSWWIGRVSGLVSILQWTPN